MDSKSLARVEIKDETKGEVEAVFATLGVVDRDNDVTQKGAFTDGAEVLISSYNHKTWEGALPVGKGVIHEVGNEAIFKGQFFLNTTAGRDTFEVVKQLGARQEWSYGFNVDESEPGDHEGKSVRMLKRMTVHEVSPVMRGAGVGTRTTYAKSFGDEISETVDAVKAAVKSAGRVAALRADRGKELSNVTKARLEELAGAVEELKALLITEEEEITEDKTDYAAETRKVYLASVAANYTEGE